MPIVDYNSCTVDGPEFRLALVEQERLLEESVKTMKSVIDSFKRVQDTGKSYSDALVTFSQSIRQLGFDQQGPGGEGGQQAANLSKAERDMAKFAVHFAKDLQYIEDARRRWLDNSQNMFLRVLAQHRVKIRDFLSETRRAYLDETRKFYHNQERTLGLKQQTGKNAEPKNWPVIDKEAEAERLDYFNRTYAYVKTLQFEQAKNKVRFFEVIATLQSVWKCFYQECNDNLSEREKNFHATNESVANYNESIQLAESELEENRHKLLMSGNLRPLGSQQLVEGYLLLLAQKKLSVAPNNWQRCFCTFNRQTRQLSLQPFSPANPDSTKTSLLSSDASLGGCVVCVGLPSNSEVDRRFLFEVELNDSTRTLLLQAYSPGEFQQWTRALRGDPADEMTQRRPTEAEAKRFEVCLFELEARCLDEEGLYRVEGRNKMVDDFVQGYMLGVVGPQQPPTLDQADPRVLSSGVKRYLKQLPEPLITFPVVNQLLVLMQSTAGPPGSSPLDSEAAEASLRRELQALPPTNLRLLTALIGHFNHVVGRFEVNKMSADNVAIVFAPTLCWPQRINLQSVQACALAGRHLVLALMRNPDGLLGLGEAPAPPTPASQPVKGPDPQGMTLPLRQLQPAASEAAGQLPSDTDSLPGMLPAAKRFDSVIVGATTTAAGVGAMTLEGPKRCARTLYACTGDSPTELSFAANELVYDVQRISRIDGWCYGVINGRAGIIPSNYIQILQ